MREATGDLNMTVIIVILVAFLVAFFSTFVGPMIRTSIRKEANCSDAICNCKKNEITNGNCTKCHLKNSTKTFSCPYKG